MIIDPDIERSAYFGKYHPENILLLMITDDRRYIRELGMRRILRARSERYEIRQFHVPRLDQCANDYIDMIDWLNTTVAEPPILAAVSEQDIEMLVADVKFQSSTSKKYPCHTQPV